MCAPLLRDAHRTGVQVEIAFAELCPRRNVGVAMQQDIPRSQRRQVFQVVHMTVGSVNEPPAHRQHRIVGQNGKIQHHLIHLSVTVAPHAQKRRLQPVQERDDLLRGIALRQVVAGAVIQKIPQQKQPVCSLPLKRFDHFFAIKRRPVQVGCDHPFHGRILLIL